MSLPPAKTFRQRYRPGSRFWNEGSRFAFHELDSETALFVDGEQYLLRGDARPFAPLLCAGARVNPRTLAAFAEDEAILGLLTNLYNQGSIYFE